MFFAYAGYVSPSKDLYGSRHWIRDRSDRRTVCGRVALYVYEDRMGLSELECKTCFRVWMSENA